VPVLLPPVELADGAAVAVAALDGLLLTGGADIDPCCYGAPADVATTGLRPDRDRWETALLRAALDRDLPVLAICRGMQVLNVALGGTLVQHVPDVVGHEGHQPARGCFGPIQVTTEPGSLVAKIVGDAVTVSCSHHQSVDGVGAGLSVVARARDGIVEAVELPTSRFVVGVEWHPEEDGDPRLFDALMDATR
jgi:gamma-glutamyl-gamma-aminobutyrate hydrolase PuuD